MMQHHDEGDMAQNREVLSSITSAYTAGIFTKRDIKHPMELILDAPMPAYGMGKALGSWRAA